MTTTIPAQATDLSVTHTATQADATLLMQILNGPIALRATDGLTLLLGYATAPSYAAFTADHPRGSQGYQDVQAILMLNETIGTFVKQGLLDRGLVYDMFWVSGIWDRCKAIALHYREQSGVAAMYENFEALAAGQTG